MFETSVKIPTEIRDRILERAASSSTPLEAATLLLDSLVEERVDEMSCSLEEVKQLLADVLRVSQHNDSTPPKRMAG
jgi:hypothetical protein